MFGKKRFGDLIARQLDLYCEENADLLAEIVEYRERWRRASRAGAEEAFGDEQDRVEWAAEEIEKMADAYARSLEEDAAIAYRAALLKRLRKRYPPIADALRVTLGDDDE